MRNDDTDVGEELVVQEDFVLEELVEELVPQVDDYHDTAPMEVPRGMRMSTSSEWPPPPPPPADVELAQGTIQHARMSARELAEGTLGGVDLAQGTIENDYDLSEETLYGNVPPVRRAAIYAAVRRPTTSSEDT